MERMVDCRSEKLFFEDFVSQRRITLWKYFRYILIFIKSRDSSSFSFCFQNKDIDGFSNNSNQIKFSVKFFSLKNSLDLINNFMAELNNLAILVVGFRPKMFGFYLRYISLPNFNRLWVWLMHTFWYVNMPNMATGYAKYFNLNVL